VKTKNVWGDTVKFITYNIWNNNINFDLRLDLLIDLIKKEKVAVLALQEVRNKETVLKIKKECNFNYLIWKKYFDCEEGLAILSNYPIMTSWTNWDDTEDVHNSGVMCVTININGEEIGITNVHLDYKYSFNREIEIVKTIKVIDDLNVKYNLIMGDFNTYPNSIIYKFLTGQQSLFEQSTNWIDLSEVYSRMHKMENEITLDFYNNPRWDNNYVLDIPGRFDWIMLKNPYPKEYPRLKNYKVIGKQRIKGITPSDHYGVLCELDI